MSIWIKYKQSKNFSCSHINRPTPIVSGLILDLVLFKVLSGEFVSLSESEKTARLTYLALLDDIYCC